MTWFEIAIIVLIIILIGVWIWYLFRYLTFTAIWNPDRVYPGDTCNSSVDCPNGTACALPYAGALEAGYGRACCFSNEIYVDPRSDIYCANLPNGTACYSDAMCESGNCTNLIIGQIGICVDKKIDRRRCRTDDECASTVCAYDGYGQNTTICCPDGEYVTEVIPPVLPGNDEAYGQSRVSRSYCRRAPNRTPCFRNDQCDSGICGLIGETRVCVPGIYPLNCSFDSQCLPRVNNQIVPGAVGACGFPSLETDQKICCPDGVTWTTPEGAPLCNQARVPDGSPCITNAMCESTYCNPDNLCQRQLAPREPCAWRGEGYNLAVCRNHACGAYLNPDTHPYQCCPGAYLLTFSIDPPIYLCAGLAVGEPCLVEVQCATSPQFPVACLNGICTPQIVTLRGK